MESTEKKKPPEFLCVVKVPLVFVVVGS